jgi:hypothetical protein
MGLEVRMIPGEAAGTKVEGQDKLTTIIWNVAKLNEA